MEEEPGEDGGRVAHASQLERTARASLRASDDRRSAGCCAKCFGVGEPASFALLDRPRQVR
eukprot:scaffold17559_cov110-Isochrysis_galbana.AAC.13